MELVKKISVASVFGDVAKNLKGADGKIQTAALMKVYGVADGTKAGQSNFGEWVAFTGNFEAVNVNNGEIFRSNIVFLPEPAHSLLLGTLQRAGENASVQFGFLIGVKASSKGSLGYEYTTQPIVEQTENDPLLALREQAQKFAALEHKSEANKKKSA